MWYNIFIYGISAREVQSVNIGLIGFGVMGRTHAYSVANLPYFYGALPFSARVLGVCTRDPAHAEEAVSLYGFRRVFTSEDELIACPDVDVVDICTPNVLHYATILKALRAGKHVLCEKPLCVTEQQAEEAAALAASLPLTSGIVFNNRFLLPVMRAKELIDAGRIGRILSFRGAYYHSSATDVNKKAGWKQDRMVCGGGVLFDLGSHILDLIYYLCGPYAEVSGMSQIAFPERTGPDGTPWRTNADEAFYISARLANGAMGTIETGKIFVGTNDDLTFEIWGTDGALRFDLMNPNWLYFYERGASETGFKQIECVGRYPAPGGNFPGAKAPVGWLRGHIGSMYSFLNAVNERRPACPSFEDALHIQSVMEAAYRSVETGRFEQVKHHA